MVHHVSILKSVVLGTTSHLDEQWGQGQLAYHFHDALESTLVADFRDALKKLEGLLYAVCGSVPNTYLGDEQWWFHPNPRCLWPEQNWIDRSSEKVAMEPGYNDWWWQTSAMGDVGGYVRASHLHKGSTGYHDWPRSCSPGLHMHYTNQDKEYFPGGCVTWARTSENWGDPLQWATITITWHCPEEVRVADLVSEVRLYLDVGGVCSNQQMISTDFGRTYKTDVAGKATGTTVLYWLKVTTNEDPAREIYSPHGDEGPDHPPSVMPPPVDPVDLPDDYSPGGAYQTLVEPDQCYWYTYFEHKSPYKYGLPELIWEEFDDPKRSALRKCTGTWKFSQWTDITPNLINIARFAVDSLASRFHHGPRARGDNPAECCFDRPIKFRWSGAQRPWLYLPGGKGGADDVRPLSNASAEENAGDVPSRKSWRGTGGIDWRQVDNPMPTIYPALGPPFPYRPWKYNVASWLTYNMYSWYQTTGGSAPIWNPGIQLNTGELHGLWPGDQVDVVHVREVIEAVKYLIDNGLWWPVPVHTCCKTPSAAMRPWTTYVDADGNSHDTFWGIQVTRTHPPAPHPPGTYDIWNPPGTVNYRPGCVWINTHVNPDHNDACIWDAILDPFRWKDWDMPNQTECLNGCVPEEGIVQYSCDDPGNSNHPMKAGKCAVWWHCTSSYYQSGSDEQWSWMARMNAEPMFADYAPCTANYEMSTFLFPAIPDVREIEAWGGCTLETVGLSYYMCGPHFQFDGPASQVNPDGSPIWAPVRCGVCNACDELHGNAYRKTRELNGDVHWEDPKLDQITMSMGNRAGQALGCGDDFPWHSKELTWDSVNSIEWMGPAPSWAGGAQFCFDPTSIPHGGITHSNVPTVPGYEHYGPPMPPDVEIPYWHRHPLCYDYRWEEWSDYTDVSTSTDCEINFVTGPQRCGCNMAEGTYAWLRVDLNVDPVSGVPRLYDYRLDCRMIGAGGTAPDTQTDFEEPDIYRTAGNVQCPHDAWPDGVPEFHPPP